MTPNSTIDAVAEAPTIGHGRKVGARFVRRGRTAPEPAAAWPGGSTQTPTPTSRPTARARGQRAGRVPTDAIIVFSRQLGSFLAAGVSVIEALDIVAGETTSDRMREVIDQIREVVLRGGSFADAVAAHPTVFTGWYRAMVRSAEYTGKLDEVLEQLAVYLDRDQAARREVKSAVTYPAFVLIIAAAAMVVMSIFVLPKFSGMYAKLGAELPLPTRILLGWTDFITAAGPFLAVGGVVSLVLAKLVLGGSGNGRRRRNRIAMRLPVAGRIYHLICVERFTRVLAALTSAGVPLPDGIEMSARSTNNSVFEERMVDVRDALLRGGGIVQPLAETELVPTAALQMIRVGEKTGSLGTQLAKASAFFDREVGYRLKRATDLLQPIIVVGVGLVIGFVAVAQVAAMYSIFGQVNP